ncbi:MAG TPA: type II secretion system protein [Myxococcota bacterium]|nr:type II secretion system protein [Myxococcota bacterium]
MRPASARAAAAAHAAFTLLEVLVAVGVLGLLYTVLAGIAMQGLRAEGESGRELRASLLADGALAELETSGDFRVAPPVEREEEDFVVTVEVAPFELELPASRRRERGERAKEPTVSLIHGGPGSPASPLRRIEVTVSWSEGVFEREVRRTSFALDPEAAAPILESLAASQEAREQADDDEPEDAPQQPSARDEGTPRPGGEE